MASKPLLQLMCMHKSETAHQVVRCQYHFWNEAQVPYEVVWEVSSLDYPYQGACVIKVLLNVFMLLYMYNSLLDVQ